MGFTHVLLRLPPCIRPQVKRGSSFLGTWSVARNILKHVSQFCLPVSSPPTLHRYLVFLFENCEFPLAVPAYEQIARSTYPVDFLRFHRPAAEHAYFLFKHDPEFIHSFRDEDGIIRFVQFGFFLLHCHYLTKSFGSIAIVKRGCMGTRPNRWGELEV